RGIALLVDVCHGVARERTIVALATDVPFLTGRVRGARFTVGIELGAAIVVAVHAVDAVAIGVATSAFRASARETVVEVVASDGYRDAAEALGTLRIVGAVEAFRTERGAGARVGGVDVRGTGEAGAAGDALGQRLRVVGVFE